MKKSGKLKRLVQNLLNYEPERIYLIGSWARGEGDDLSDFDLIIIKKTQIPFLDRLKEVSKMLGLEEGGVDIIVYTPEELEKMRQQGNAFAEMIIEEGQIIYDKQKKK